MHENHHFSSTYDYMLFVNFVASAIQCWVCSSDSSKTEFCKDPFKGNDISEHEKKLNLINCPEPNGARASCKKVINIGGFSIFYY